MFRIHALVRVAALIFVVAAGGCGPGTPDPSDPAKAREVLKKALDAWMRNESADSLKSGDAPIVAVDRQWQQGVKLVEYTIDEKSSMNGFDVQLTAMLSLQDAAGKSGKQKASYAVSTSPKLVVVRSEPGS